MGAVPLNQADLIKLIQKSKFCLSNIKVHNMFRKLFLPVFINIWFLWSLKLYLVLMWHAVTDIGNVTPQMVQRVRKLLAKYLACYCIPFSCINIFQTKYSNQNYYKKEIPEISEFFSFLFWLTMHKQSYFGQNNRPK